MQFWEQRRVRLGTILVLLVLVTTVPLGLFAAHLIYTSWRQQNDQLNQQNEGRAHAIAAAIDREVQNTIAQLNIISSLEPIDAGDVRAFYDVAAKVVRQRSGWQSLRLVDPAATVVFDTALPYGSPATLVNDDWVKSIRDGHPFAVSTVRRDPASGSPFVSIGVPVIRGGRLRFILGARVLASEFSEILRRQTAPPGGVATLLDSDLTIMARTRAEDVYLLKRPTDQFAAAIRAAHAGTIRSTMLEGMRSYSAWHTSPVTGWTIGLGRPADDIDGPLWWSLGALIAVMMTLLGSGLVLAVLVSRRIVRAQVGAVATARALARGERAAPMGSTVAEFNDLAIGLRDAAAILDQRLRERDAAEAEHARATETLAKTAADLERALIREQAARAAGERNEARLTVTLRSIGDAVIATDAQGRVTMVNPVAQALTGWPEADAIGEHIDTVFETVDEHTRRPNPSPMARVLANDAATPFSANAVLMARDGRDIPIGDSCAAMRSADGALLGVVVVFRDVTSDRDAERQRAAALAREQAARRTAETLSRAKDEFVATVSHELRTPLNAIYGWVAMLKMGSLDAAGQAKALDVIDRNTRVQAQLIEDLLDMARVIRGTVRLEMHPVDLAVALESALDAVKPAADARRVTMRVDAPRGIALVSGDSSRLQQIAWNLLSNSIKFSEAGDEVDVRLSTEDNDAVLRVHDTGTGIDPAFLPHVFDRFRQETSDVTREHAGLGLGLSLVRHLAELHGGTVTAESEGKDLGSTFTVRLPLIGARAGAAADFESADAAMTQDVKPDALKDLQIVVVDDDPDARELIGTVLRQAGAEVRAAASVREAIELLETNRPDIVITDIAMPHATGFDLVKHMHEDPRWSEIPVIAVTAYARAEDRAQALALGFHAHVGKPFSPRALVAVAAELARR
ncbi:MAG TPA: ATP-binding protein [Vicinamibacterales bacterium]|nr:ATP-binding protein [Vicinamibacterales bacterium]